MSTRLDPMYAVQTPTGSIGVHDLTLGEASADAPVVLLVHGITANGLCWRSLAREIDSRHGSGTVRVLAPDLRGRGASSAAGQAPEAADGLARHVDDLLRVLTAFAVEAPVVVGHSMGAFVAALLAARAPDRVGATVLVDGGIALPAPDGADPDSWSTAEVDAVLARVLGPALARLDLTWADADEHLAFWSEHPAVGPLLTSSAGPAVRDWLTHDLVPTTDGRVRSSCAEKAVRADGRDVLIDPATAAAAPRAAAHGVPLTFLWAGRGLLDQVPGLYPAASVPALTDGVAHEVVAVPAANHYDILLLEPGLTAVADAVDGALTGVLGTR